MKIQEQKMQEFRDRIQSFNFLRQSRVSHWQAIYTGLLITAIILFVDLIAPKDIFLKIVLIVGLVALSEVIYRKAILQTQKPVIVCENAVGTLEDMKIVGDYAVCNVSDFIHNNSKKMQEAKK